jgi:two-component system invasion response regulator UvrY
VREGLKQVLADAPDIMVCGEAATGPEVLAQVQALMGAAPQGTLLDVVLLDIAMPGATGWTCCRPCARVIPACLC